MARPRSISDDQIRDAAREVFVEHGPAAPVSLVAARLGVSHAALFGRSGSKQRLMLDSLCPGRPEALEELMAPPPRRRARARLVAILLDLMGFFHRVVPNLVVLKSAGLGVDALPGAGSVPPPVAIRQALAVWLDAAAATGSLPRVVAPQMAEALLGAIEARCFNAYMGGQAFAPGGDAAFVRELVGALLGASRRRSRS